MSLLDDVKKKASDTADEISDKANIAKQRLEGEADKAKGKADDNKADELKGEAKIKASQSRDKMND